MRLCTTSGYCIDLMSGFCTNVRHGDSHVWNWVLQKDYNKINSKLNVEEDSLGFDWGWKFMLAHSPYLMLMPSLSKKKPIDTFLIKFQIR